MICKRVLFIFFGFILILGIGCVNKENISVFKGPYLGQKPPGMAPEIFVPGIIITCYHEHSSPAFSPDCEIKLSII